MTEKIYKERTKAIANLAVMLVLLANAALTLVGKDVLPWSENEVATFVSQIAAAGWSVWCWWKNQNVTTDAVKRDAGIPDKAEEVAEGEDENDLLAKDTGSSAVPGSPEIPGEEIIDTGDEGLQGNDLGGK